MEDCWLPEEVQDAPPLNPEEQEVMRKLADGIQGTSISQDPMDPGSPTIRLLKRKAESPDPSTAGNRPKATRRSPAFELQNTISKQQMNIQLLDQQLTEANDKLAKMEREIQQLKNDNAGLLGKVTQYHTLLPVLQRMQIGLEKSS
ncbi:unnamed protein product, partial [Mesorhabditis spiculigera]